MLCKNKLKKYMTSEVRFRVFHNLFKILVAPPLSLLIITLAHPANQPVHPLLNNERSLNCT